MAPNIRSIQKSDESGWRNLWQQYNDFYERTVPEEVTTTTFGRLLDQNVRMHGAVAVNETDSNILGFVHWYPHLSTSSIEEQVYIHDLFVDTSDPAKGTGRALIEHVFEWSKALPAKSVYWHTQFFNHRAQLLYVKVADRTDFVVYRKTL